MKLLPCPFCGSQAPEPDDEGEIANDTWTVDVTRLGPRMDGKPSALISVEIRHWCGNGTRTIIRTTGRDHDEAERLWNRRTSYDR